MAKKKAATRRPKSADSNANKGQTVSLDQLQLDPGNSCVHDDRNLEVITGSIRDVGAGRSVLMDGDGIIRAGNGTVQGAQRAGIAKARIIETDGTELIVVKRTDLHGAKAVAAGVADNRSSDLHRYDGDKLRDQLSTIEAEIPDFNFEGIGLSEDDLDDLLSGLETTSAESDEAVPEIEEEEPPKQSPTELQKQFRTRKGQLWLITSADGTRTHRLLCGDCRVGTEFGKLVEDRKISVAFTSPPYAEQREYDKTSGFKPIHPDQYVEWFADVASNVERHLAADGSFLVNIKPACEHLDRYLYVFDLILAFVRSWGWHFADEFCWERNGIPQKPARRLKNQFEPIYQFVKGEWKFRPESVRHHSSNVPVAQGAGAGDTNAAKRQGVTSAIDGNEISEGLAYPGNRLQTFAGSHQATGHSAAFPTGLPAWFFRLMSDEGDVVCDPFCGSGSSLIAAEQTQREGLGVEISPKYVAVTLQRMTDLGCSVQLQS